VRGLKSVKSCSAVVEDLKSISERCRTASSCIHVITEQTWRDLYLLCLADGYLANDLNSFLGEVPTLNSK
jgi:hypothetical protein